MGAILAACLALGAQGRPAPLKDAYAGTGECSSLAFSPDGTLLAVGGTRSVRILAVPTRDDGRFEEARAFAPYGRVDELLFDSRGRWLVTRSRDQDARVWEASSGKPVRFALEQGLVAAPGPRDWLVLPGRAKGLRFWRTDGLSGKRRFVQEAGTRESLGVALGHVTAAAWTDSALLAGDDQGFLHVVPSSRILSPLPDPRFPPPPPRSAASARLFRPHAGEIATLAPSADGRLCVSAGLDGRGRLWEVARLPSGPRPRGAGSPAPVWEIAGHAAELSANGGLLAVAEAGGVGVYHAASGVPVSWNPVRGRTVRLRFGPDGRFLAAVVCRCAGCTPGERIETISARKRLADHGGTLVVWR